MEKLFLDRSIQKKVVNFSNKKGEVGVRKKKKNSLTFPYVCEPKTSHHQCKLENSFDGR